MANEIYHAGTDPDICKSLRDIVLRNIVDG